IDSLININGVYVDSKSWSKEPTISSFDSMGHVFIFYSNGFFLKDACISCFLSNKTKYNGGGEWGLFSIHGDTIKAQFIEPPGCMSWSKGEIWFEIIDKQTIQLLYIKYYDAITEIEVKNHLSKKNGDISIYKFLPLADIPDYNKCWLIKERWLWCNGLEYEKWKEKK
nr:hypothetical protein [Tenuifilaceae bacterium]